MTKTITISITVPDGVEVQVAGNAPAPANAEVSVGDWPGDECPKHGPDHWSESKFGGYYCTAKDPSQQPKGYCVLKSGVVWNGKRIPQ